MLCAGSKKYITYLEEPKKENNKIINDRKIQSKRVFLIIKAMKLQHGMMEN